MILCTYQYIVYGLLTNNLAIGEMDIQQENGTAFRKIGNSCKLSARFNFLQQHSLMFLALIYWSLKQFRDGSKARQWQGYIQH